MYKKIIVIKGYFTVVFMSQWAKKVLFYKDFWSFNLKNC